MKAARNSDGGGRPSAVRAVRGGHDGVVDEQLRRGMLRLSAMVLDGSVRAADEVAPTVTSTQLRVLGQLSADGDSTVSAVAASHGVAVSTISRLADRLAGAGMVVRRPSEGDRREVVLALTRQGRALASRWQEERSHVLLQMVDELPGAARERAHELLRVLASPDAEQAGRRGVGGPAPSAVGDDELAGGRAARAVRELTRELVAVEADAVPEVLVACTARLLDAPAVALRLLSPDGRQLRWVAGGDGPGDGGDPPRPAPTWSAPGDEPVATSPAGQCLRAHEPVVEVEGRWSRLHLPLSHRTAHLGVLTVRTPVDPPRDPAWGDLALELAETAAALLPTASAGSRRTALAARTREWTVGAEMQGRQLPGPRLVAHGLHVAAHLEPAYDSATDAYDLELVDVPGSGPAVDLAVLDCRSGREHSVEAVALALGALRHARGLGRGPAEQASLVDQALFGRHHGHAAVDVLLLRVQLAPWAVHLVATSGITAHRQGPTELEALPLVEHETPGVTGDSSYRAQTLPVRPGQRLLVLGDGLGRSTADGATRRAEQIAHRARDEDADEVVRRVVADLLDASGPDGPDQDATVVCLDL